jgi:crossover junction endodeoxyribonuclease RuvC
MDDRDGAPERILGVDPGSRATGYGVVELRRGRVRVLDQGVIRPSLRLPLPERLLRIRDQLRDIQTANGCGVLSVETLFLGRNPRSAHVLAQVRGAVLLAGAECGCEVFEYTPMQVKKSVTGYGKADKEQVRTMITMLLSLSRPPATVDAADALAAAYCHAARRAGMRALAEAGGGSSR